VGFVQANSAFTGGPLTLSGVALHATLVAYIQGNSTMASTTLPAPWQKLTMRAGTGGGVDVWGCLWVYDDHPGGSVSSAITTAPSTPAWAIGEYSGRDAVAIESQGNNNGVGTAWTSANLAVPEGADVVVGCGQMATGFTITYTSPYTRRTGQDGHVMAFGDDENVAAGSSQGTGTVSSNPADAWVACAVALKAAGPPIAGVGMVRPLFYPGRGPKPRWVRHWDNQEWDSVPPPDAPPKSRQVRSRTRRPGRGNYPR